jgi:hypothetical protein
MLIIYRLADLIPRPAFGLCRQRREERFMRRLVLLFVSSLAIASADASETAKQGNDSSTVYYVQIAPNEYAGIKRTDNGDAMFDRMAIRSTYRGGSHGDLVMIPCVHVFLSAAW